MLKSDDQVALRGGLEAASTGSSYSRTPDDSLRDMVTMQK